MANDDYCSYGLVHRNYTNKSEIKIIGLEPCYSISVSEITRCGQAAESERRRIITALHRYEKARGNGSGLRSYRCVRTHGYMTR